MTDAKQIKELANDIQKAIERRSHGIWCSTLAEALYAKGWRKQTAKRPIKESLADYLCPKCGNYIPFDALNGRIEHAPRYCSHCGQPIDWSKEEAKHDT